MMRFRVSSHKHPGAVSGVRVGASGVTMAAYMLGAAMTQQASATLPPSYSSTRVGLYGPGYVSSSGQSSVQFDVFSTTGWSAGSSVRYEGALNRGRDAWVTSPDGGTTRQIGFIGPGYESVFGTRSSQGALINSVGQVVGVSARFSGTTALGGAAWLTGPSGLGITQVGLTGAGYQKLDGTTNQTPRYLSETGRVSGHTARFNGNSDRGQDAWVFDASLGSTTLVGLIGAAYELPNGFRSSSVLFQSATGYTVGQSNRYGVEPTNGSDAWIVRPGSGTTVQIGFVGAGYEQSADGYRISQVHRVNDQGRAIGNSARFSGLMSRGYDTWITGVDGAGITQVGLTGADYTRNDGYRSSGVAFVDATGRAAGGSSRFVGTLQGLGGDAWVSSPDGTTHRVGLTGPGYEALTGQRSSTVGMMSGTGYFGGSSQRYAADSGGRGEAVWISDPVAYSTTRVGLWGAGYEMTNGYASSVMSHLNGSGCGAGHSLRYSGDASDGRDAWVTNAGGTITRRAGLVGGVYDGPNRASQVSFLNAAGEAVGWSRRTMGEAGWFFDPVQGVSHELVFSVRADGYALTLPRVLTDSGVVLGAYEAYDGSVALGSRAFWWSLETGFYDLGSLVAGGLDAAGWQWLTSVVNAAGTDPTGAPLFIAGYGQALGETDPTGLYVLHVVPAPGAAAMLVMMGMVVGRRRR